MKSGREEEDKCQRKAHTHKKKNDSKNDWGQMGPEEHCGMSAARSECVWDVEYTA